jgi:hypothetical protein
MHHALTQPLTDSTQPSQTERGAYIRELKRAYEAGELGSEIAATQVSEMLISALFEETQPPQLVVH